MQRVARAFEHLLRLQGKTMTVLVATSGDTGPAAIEGFRGRAGVNVFVFFPQNGTSPFQRAQMTTGSDENIFALGIDGTFDDCQKILKTLGNQPDFVSRFNIS